jgi:hypothetical protein
MSATGPARGHGSSQVPSAMSAPMKNLPDLGLVRQETTGMMGGGFPEVDRLGADV